MNFKVFKDINGNSIKTDFSLFCLKLYFEEISWMHANPTLYAQNQQVLDEYYVEHKNSQKVIEYLNNYEIEGFKLIYGSKGSGKTFLTNYFLNRYTRKLNDKGFSWIRIDITKIYVNYFKMKPSLSIEEYLFGQIVFVYFRYHQESSKTKKNNFDKIYSEYSYKSIEENFFKTNDEFEAYKNNILDVGNYLNGLEGKPFKDAITQKIAKFLIKKLGKKLLLFVDGIDNIDYDIDKFNNIKKDIKKFFKQYSGKFHNIIFTVREDYKNDFENFVNASSDDISKAEAYGIQREIEVIPIEFQSFMKKKQIEFIDKKHIKIDDDFIIAVLNNLKKVVLESEDIDKIEELLGNKENLKKIATNQKLGNFFIKNQTIRRDLKSFYKVELVKLIKNCLLSEVNQKLIEEFFNFTQSAEELVKKALVEKDVIQNNTKFSLLRDMFNNDLRELINLLIDSFMYICKYISRKNTMNLGGNVVVKYLYKEPSLLMEAFFKNGNIYTVSASDKKYIPPYRNYNFLNIFNPLFKKETEINVLVFPYMLNYILKNVNVTKKELFDFLSICLDLNEKKNEEIIIDTLSTYFEYGYIKLDAENKKINLNNDALKIKPTKKLELVFEYSLKDINVLQSYIYGALMKDEYLDNMIKYSYKWDGYWSATLQNTVIFLKFLEELENNVDKKYANYKLNLIQNEYIKKDFFDMYHKAIEMLGELNLTFVGKIKVDLTNIYETLISDLVIIKNKLKKLEYEDLKETFRDLDNTNDRIYLLKLLSLSNKDILENYYLHNFVFGDFNHKKFEKRKKDLNEFSILKTYEKAISKIKSIKNFL